MKSPGAVLGKDLNANPQPLGVIQGPEGKEVRREVQRIIAERAYELFQGSGCGPGNDLAHWLHAEREILDHISNVRESGPWVVVNLDLPSVPLEGVKIFVDRHEVLVTVEDTESLLQKMPKARVMSCYVAQWPAAVDPSTAGAYVKNGTLTLEVKMWRGSEVQLKG